MMPDATEISPRRSAGHTQTARALWHIAPGQTQMQIETLLSVRDDLARVQTLYSGISRGTEKLVLSGAVPETEWHTMRAPMQQGDFPFPVKYGYCAVGQVMEGTDNIFGKTVFCLHPHQDQFVVPHATLTTIPENIPPRRAVLAANAETALNALWDSGISAADRVMIIGGGLVGLLVASLASRIPATEVTVVDTNPKRHDIALAIGAGFATPDDAPVNCDCIFHTSATGAGLQLAIASAGNEATVVEMSWYGAHQITASFGGAFHSKRLKLVSSQVGQIAPTRRPRWSYERRMQKAVALLDDPRLDALVADEITFEEAPEKLPAILSNDYLDLPPVIRYAKAAG